MISSENYKDCLDYIENYWNKITFFGPKDNNVHIGLPNEFVSPNAEWFKGDQFYWDSYFIILGLITMGKVELAKGMVENFIYLYERFGIIPLRNRFYDTGKSQPPFLTSMILEVFNETKDKEWLKKTTLTAEHELENYWMKLDGEKVTCFHLAYKGLSRYCDNHLSHVTAEHESGWDTTSRFNEKGLDYLPVDLNSCLYKYEIDLEKIYEILGNKEKKERFKKRARKRKEIINESMWNIDEGFYFDFNYNKEEKNTFWSLASFFPLFVNLASEEQAKRVKDNISKFECDFGLANTQKEGLNKTFKQWDYPNGFPNLQYVVIKGLLNYGHKSDARRLAKKWLDLNKKVFKNTGGFWEKYNVVEGDIGIAGRYPTQSGFGWTNAIFLKLLKDFDG